MIVTQGQFYVHGPDPLTHDTVAKTLRAWTYSFADEYGLHSNIADALADAQHPFVPEARLDAQSRIDFLVDRIGIEAKIAGSVDQVSRQIDRYLARDELDGLVVITTRTSHKALEGTRNGKPVSVVHVSPLNGTIVHRGTHDTSQLEPGTITRSGNVWLIKAQPHLAIRFKRAFPRIRQHHDKTLSIAADIENARDIQWLMERWPLTISDADAATLGREADEHRDKGDALARILVGQDIDGDWREPSRPARWPHQTINANMISAMKRLLITDQLGGGKTFSALMAFRNPDSLPAVIVCPVHLQRQWQREISLTWRGLNTHIVAKRDAYKPPPNTDILIIPYSKLAGWSAAVADTARTLILDEVHELRRGLETGKGSAAGFIAQYATYVVGLSATPIFNYGGEIHNIMGFVRPGVLGERPEFLSEWCGETVNGKSIVGDPDALAAYLRQEGAMVGATLPPTEVVRIEHVVESDPDVFDKVAGDVDAMAARLLDETTDRQDRWRMSGEFDMRMRQATGIAKAPYVATFVEMLLESIDKVVLFGWHREVYRLWNEQLAKHGHKVAMYTGSESDAQKDASRRAFIEGDARVLLMSLRSGAGLDGLQTVCNTCVFGELDWSPAQHSQAIGRLDRPGLVEPPTLAYFLTSEDGTDPFMIDVLGVKDRQSAPFTNRDVATLAPSVAPEDRVRDMARARLARRH